MSQIPPVRFESKRPQMSPNRELCHAGDHAVEGLAEDFGISRATVQRAIGRTDIRTVAP